MEPQFTIGPKSPIYEICRGQPKCSPANDWFRFHCEWLCIRIRLGNPQCEHSVFRPLSLPIRGGHVPLTWLDQSQTRASRVDLRAIAFTSWWLDAPPPAQQRWQNLSKTVGVRATAGFQVWKRARNSVPGPWPTHRHLSWRFALQLLSSPRVSTRAQTRSHRVSNFTRDPFRLLFSVLADKVPSVRDLKTRLASHKLRASCQLLSIGWVWLRSARQPLWFRPYKRCFTRKNIQTGFSQT